MKGIEDVVKVWHEDSTEGLGIASAKKYKPGLRARGKAALKYVRAKCLKEGNHNCFSNNCTCWCHRAISGERKSNADRTGLEIVRKKA